MPPADATTPPVAGRGHTITDLAKMILSRGLTVSEVARRYRVGEDRVRGWIKSGKLAAINTSDAQCARPRYVVLPEALAEFERARCVAPPPKVVRRRRPKTRDYFPDL